jgi:NAD(P)-dependent dehydrogenase (short-subunit alcohol dehydrogenase family)
MAPMLSARSLQSQGKVAIVAGSAQGIGEAITKRFIEVGENVLFANTQSEVKI